MGEQTNTTGQAGKAFSWMASKGPLVVFFWVGILWFHDDPEQQAREGGFLLATV